MFKLECAWQLEFHLQFDLYLLEGKELNPAVAGRDAGYTLPKTERHTFTPTTNLESPVN